MCLGFHPSTQPEHFEYAAGGTNVTDGMNIRSSLGLIVMSALKPDTVISTDDEDAVITVVALSDSDYDALPLIETE